MNTEAMKRALQKQFQMKELENLFDEENFFRDGGSMNPGRKMNPPPREAPRKMPMDWRKDAVK